MCRISELEGTLEGSSFNLIDDQREIPLTASLLGTSPTLPEVPLQVDPTEGSNSQREESMPLGPI